jgi:hypothetical protein
MDYRTKTLLVRDKVTGFIGVVTGHADYLTGCDQYLVQPASKNNEWNEGRWFDANRLEVKSEEKPVLIDSNENGADKPAPVK